MAANFNTLPPLTNLSESPIIYNLQDGTSDVNNDSYQMVLDLKVYQGDVTTDEPATPQFTLNKFPVRHWSDLYSTANFDVSNIINSFMTSSLVDEYENALESTQFWFRAEAYSKWKVGGAYVTSSHWTSGQRLALPGYNLWGENELLYSGSGAAQFEDYVTRWPILSCVPTNVSQSISTLDNPIYFSTYNKANAPYDIPAYYRIKSSAGFIVDRVAESNPFSNSYHTVTQYLITTDELASASLADWIEIEALDSSLNTLGTPLHYEIDCQKKYTPVSIIFKNRYGGFDNFEFSLVSRQSFDVQTKNYKSNALQSDEAVYNRYYGEQIYYTEGGETLTVNSDFVDESMNDFFKQLMASDEIYWVLNGDMSDPGIYADLQPLTLLSKNLQFKKEEVDKLIQYQFVFKYGTPYKLTL